MDNKEMNSNQKPVQISIFDGRKQYEVVNKQGEVLGILLINPSDVGIVERYEKVSQMMEDSVEKLREIGVTGNGNAEEMKFADALKEASDEIKKNVDYLFDGNVSDTFFARTNPFSPIGDKFYIENVMEVVAKVIEIEFDTVVKKAKKRAAKYTNRYAPKYHN